eukprot:gene9935-biopygen22770
MSNKKLPWVYKKKLPGRSSCLYNTFRPGAAGPTDLPAKKKSETWCCTPALLPHHPQDRPACPGARFCRRPLPAVWVGPVPAPPFGKARPPATSTTTVTTAATAEATVTRATVVVTEHRQRRTNGPTGPSPAARAAPVRAEGGATGGRACAPARAQRRVADARQATRPGSARRFHQTEGAPGPAGR